MYDDGAEFFIIFLFMMFIGAIGIIGGVAMTKQVDDENEKACNLQSGIVLDGDCYKADSLVKIEL